MNQNQSTRVLGASETTGRDDNLFRMPNGDEHQQNGDAGGAGHEASLLVGLAVGPRARGGSRETDGAVPMGGTEVGAVPVGGTEREKRKARAGVLADYIRIDWTRVNCGCGEHLRLQGAVQLGLTEGRERGAFIQTEVTVQVHFI